MGDLQPLRSPPHESASVAPPWGFLKPILLLLLLWEDAREDLFPLPAPALMFLGASLADWE